MPEDERIESILAHLDKEVASGTMRMSVEVDEEREGEPLVSHRGSRIYGDDASRIVATRCVNRTAVDGHAARDVDDIGVISIRNIAGSTSTVLTASDTGGTASGIVSKVPCSALRIDGAAVDGDIAAALRI